MAWKSVFRSSIDWTRVWWTPPAGPHEAWLLEKRHIEQRFGLNSLISLTDHDDIEAPLSIRAFEECRDVPISVEWTVPYGPTFFHLGIHNLRAGKSRRIMQELARVTASRSAPELADVLANLAREKDTLIVFNHPCWDESGIGREHHLGFVALFARHYGAFIHALELNGWRPWQENRDVLEMARQLGKPVVAGGDRHGLEPNTLLDLTSAATFSEFVERVRAGRTHVLVTNQYREPLPLRILQVCEEIFADRENHPRGWRRWSDRVFYRCDDGIVRSLTTVFADRAPASVRLFARLMRGIGKQHTRQTLRFAFARRQNEASRCIPATLVS